MVYLCPDCIRAAYIFSEDQIGYALRTQLTWTHLLSLMSIEDELKRSCYQSSTILYAIAR